MPIADDSHPISMRRKLILFALDMKPSDLSAVIGHPVRTALVLRGAEKLTRPEAERFGKAAAARVRKVFE